MSEYENNKVLPTPTTQLTWRVLMPRLEGDKRSRLIVVKADYYRVDDGGNVVFRNKNDNGYPVPIRLFARGFWVSVELWK